MISWAVFVSRDSLWVGVLMCLHDSLGVSVFMSNGRVCRCVFVIFWVVSVCVHSSLAVCLCVFMITWRCVFLITWCVCVSSWFLGCVTAYLRDSLEGASVCLHDSLELCCVFMIPWGCVFVIH